MSTGDCDVTSDRNNVSINKYITVSLSKQGRQDESARLYVLSEQEIISSDRELQYHKDRIVALKHQEETISRVLENEKSQIDAIKELLKIVEDGQKAVDERGVEALDDLSRTFCLMQDEYYEEYMMFELADLSISIVFPLIKKKLEDWNPLEDDNSIRDIFKRWKDILEEGTTMNNYSVRKDVELPDRYHRLVWEIWMPFVRKTITNTWSARDSDPLIEFLENWMPIIPQWITENILEQLALPRLQNEVDVWNPLTDTMPIHSWLHPWLPLMGEKLEPLYLPIRQKFGSALTCWHPSDGSAKLILQPWVQVFSKGTMQAFVVRHILPKLVTVVQEFVINPHQQHLDPWKWVMLWEEFLPLQSLVSLLDKNFFPQWTQVLCTWLNSDPDFEEVTKWYQGWKSMFSSQLLADRAIKNRFNQALDFMDRSVSQPSRPRFPQNNVGSSPLLNNVPRPPQRFNTHDNNQPYYPLPHRMPNNSPQRDYEAIMVRGASSAASVNMNFRDLIGHKAEENNLIFVPVPDRFYEGKQVYRFGHLLICIDRTVIFYLNPDNQMWLPTSIGNLLSMYI